MSGGTFIIAEAGVNHNGDLHRALELIDAARLAGADAVKFQTFEPTSIASQWAGKAPYQKKRGGGEESQLSMLARLALSESDHDKLVSHAAAAGIKFLSTPFDLPSVRLLIDRLKLSTIKIGSGDLTNALLLFEVARSGVRIILSTGMSNIQEIRVALGIIAFGILNPSGLPSSGTCAAAFESSAGQEALKKNVTLLHCTTAYPTPSEEVNLRAMTTLANTFSLPVGLSDHSMGVAVCHAAVALGATVIEKHLTLDRTLPGPDHFASLEPDDFITMVKGVREIEMALGDGVKGVMPSERDNMVPARKSLVAARAIRKGERFGLDNLTVKRPGNGVPALSYWSWIGQTADRDYAADEMIAL